MGHDHEIYSVTGTLLDTIRYEGPVAPGVYEGPAWEAYSAACEATRERAVARAWELHGLSYERRNPGWLESDHRSFACAETPDGEHVRVETPVGAFLLAAKRARAGQTKTAFTVSATAVGYGTTAAEDQTSLPVEICGRLNAPIRGVKGLVDRDDWTYQPESFTYADGTSSDFLGSYPRVVEILSE